jgi:type I restriction enzyme S subunit
MTQTDLGTIKISVPSIKNQHEILRYLDIVESKYLKIEAGIIRKMELLNDYKKSLIYEYVTGKKEA